MLWPGPKSTASWPGTPRNAVMTRRCSRSPTAQLLEQLADRLGAVARGLHGFDQALGEPRRQVLDLLEDGLQELAFAGSLHGGASQPTSTLHPPHAAGPAARAALQSARERRRRGRAARLRDGRGGAEAARGFAGGGA